MRRLPVIALASTAAFLVGCTTTSTPRHATRTAPQTASHAANGVEALSPDEILDLATAAFGGARSFRITSQKTAPGGPRTVDETDVGEDFIRTLEFPTVTTVVLMVDGIYYAKLTEDLLKTLGEPRPEADLTAFVGKYLQAHYPPDALLGLGSGRYADDVKQQLSSAGTLTTGRTMEINGQLAIELVRAPEMTSIYVALAGEPYPLRVEVGWPSDSATPHPDGPRAIFDISAFNQGQHIEAPAPEDQVDMNDFLAR